MNLRGTGYGGMDWTDMAEERNRILGEGEVVFFSTWC
jgi:hypothetical protein